MKKALLLTVLALMFAPFVVGCAQPSNEPATPPAQDDDGGDNGGDTGGEDMPE